MKVLLDECVPRPLAKLLIEPEISTVQKSGWSGIANGDLIRRAEGKFDAFITADKNLRYQQNINTRKLGIIELPTPDWAILKNLGQTINDALRSLRQDNNYIEIQLP